VRPEVAAMLRQLLLVAICLAAGVQSAAANPDRWQREGWKTDFSKTLISWDEIMSGGPPKDGIPSIDDPKFIPVSEERELGPKEPVMSLEIDGDARAYPLRVLTWHEIVNDRVGGVPVAVTYCPLCNSGVVFDRRLDGRLLEFGTTGKLRNSDLVMYDRHTESWWQQFTGKGIVGHYAGKRLDILPARLESITDFRERHPEGDVLVPNDPDMRRYGMNPYTGYDSSTRPLLYRGEMPEGIEPLARVVVVRIDPETPVIVGLKHLRERGPLTFGSVKVTWRPGQNSALDSARISKGRDVGTVEAVEIAGDGTSKPVPYDVTFAFVANAFHPDVPIRMN
ncbi:MAG: DUF3179 domain-containing protein, partial [Dichotomicrobium sp.]